LESWTADPQIAIGWVARAEDAVRVVLSTRVPLTRMASMPTAGVGNRFAREFVVRGGPATVLVTRLDR
jgi:hypothetical protein